MAFSNNHQLELGRMIHCCTSRLLRGSYRTTQTFSLVHSSCLGFEVIFHRVVHRIVTIRTKFFASMNNITINCTDASVVPCTRTPTNLSQKIILLQMSTCKSIISLNTARKGAQNRGVRYSPYQKLVANLQYHYTDIICLKNLNNYRQNSASRYFRNKFF